jgi:transposase
VRQRRQEQLGAISKRGDGYLHTLLTHGARAVARIGSAGPKSAPGEWIGRLLQRRPVNVAVLAQANKTARIAWAVLTKGEDYGRPAAAAA